ncbi:hypothetical protein MVEN_02413100 [Mycena venus]|uniref:Uncharacterized protein n=1 Tax=Mycena venus TaxID=2733690 RepID=A0A8H7CAP6_9AGAR|nr:hypothetical protein MVEN_02413100 [Mycena venus]
MTTVGTKRRAVVAMPSAAQFDDFYCTEEDAREPVDAVLHWLSDCTEETQADRLNYLEQTIFHKLHFNTDKVNKFKKLKADRLPAFSDMKWDRLAPVYELGSSFRLLSPKSQESYVVPICYLPFHLHRRFKAEGWLKMDVNGDVETQSMEAGIVNLGAYAIESVLSLFSGRIISRSEVFLPKSLFSRGGRVEYQFFTLGNTLIVVGEFKLGNLTNDNAAQLFAEMISAAEANESRYQRVHGMLSDMDSHFFYSYNPQNHKFTQGLHFTTKADRRILRLNNMVPVINYLFSVCLDAMKDLTYFTKNFCASRRNTTDISSTNVEEVKALPTPPDLERPAQEKKSLPLWNESYELIRQAQERMQFSPEETLTVKLINERGDAGLELLYDSMNCLPRLSSLEKGLGPKTFSQLTVLINTESAKDEPKAVVLWQEELERMREEI